MAQVNQTDSSEDKRILEAPMGVNFNPIYTMLVNQGFDKEYLMALTCGNKHTDV